MVGNDLQWCFSQVKGAVDEDVAEGELRAHLAGRAGFRKGPRSPRLRARGLPGPGLPPALGAAPRGSARRGLTPQTAVPAEPPGAGRRAGPGRLGTCAVVRRAWTA